MPAAPRLAHGFPAKTIRLTNAERARVYRLRKRWGAETNPAGDPDRDRLVRDLARAIVLLQRLGRVEADLWGLGAIDAAMTLRLRHAPRLVRTVHRALLTLETGRPTARHRPSPAPAVREETPTPASTCDAPAPPPARTGEPNAPATAPVGRSRTHELVPLPPTAAARPRPKSTVPAGRPSRRKGLPKRLLRRGDGPATAHGRTHRVAPSRTPGTPPARTNLTYATVPPHNRFTLLQPADGRTAVPIPVQE
jgi:hypothetical protein